MSTWPMTMPLQSAQVEMQTFGLLDIFMSSYLEIVIIVMHSCFGSLIIIPECHRYVVYLHGLFGIHVEIVVGVIWNFTTDHKVQISWPKYFFTGKHDISEPFFNKHSIVYMTDYAPCQSIIWLFVRNNWLLTI